MMEHIMYHGTPQRGAIVFELYSAIGGGVGFDALFWRQQARPAEIVGTILFC
jgi:hypothetical protein